MVTALREKGISSIFAPGDLIARPLSHLFVCQEMALGMGTSDDISRPIPSFETRPLGCLLDCGLPGPGVDADLPPRHRRDSSEAGLLVGPLHRLRLRGHDDDGRRVSPHRSVSAGDRPQEAGGQVYTINSRNPVC